MSTDRGGGVQATVAAPAAPVTRYGEVFDRGYAHYDGNRLGRSGAFRSLVGYSMKRALGLRKSWTAKVLPFLLYTSAIIPLIVMIGISAIIPDSGFASYSGYMTSIFTVVGIFVATAAPEMLCVDRGERTLPLYFSRAISRFDYVLAKVLAMTALTMTLSVVPAVILWLGRQLVADSPWRAMRDNVGDLWRVILLGSLIALTLGTLGLVISSITARKGVAVTIIIISFIVLTSVAQIGMELLSDYDWSRYLILASGIDTFQGVSTHLFKDVSNFNVDRADLSLGFYITYCLALVVLGILFLRWRYAPRDDA
ncbi:MAG: ABC transporter permease subunit [Chloroflexia bacterium]|nr:ABC transporter permease subunit [Chloroflexia bacterium]